MDTKKLRQKILVLAIRGKLVPQDPNDEPASVLLERIKEEKERLIKEGKIRKSKRMASSDMPHYENVPFEIPSSWEWTTINTISKSILYGVSESAKTNGKYRLLRITDIQNNSVQWDSVPYTDFDENKAKSYLLSDGDILPLYLCDACRNGVFEQAGMLCERIRIVRPAVAAQRLRSAVAPHRRVGVAAQGCRQRFDLHARQYQMRVAARRPRRSALRMIRICSHCRYSAAVL